MHELLKCGPQFENENMKIDHFLLLQEGGRGGLQNSGQERSQCDQMLDQKSSLYVS